jgi:hypothetical protein
MLQTLIDQRARIKTCHGGEHLIFAELAGVNNERIQLFGSKAHGPKPGRSTITGAGSGASPLDVRPSKIG